MRSGPALCLCEHWSDDHDEDQKCKRCDCGWFSHDELGEREIRNERRILRDDIERGK